jgi:hypothetical protein
MNPETQKKLIRNLKDKSSNLSLGLTFFAFLNSLRRMRKHYRCGNVKRTAWFAFAAGEQLGMFGRDVEKRLHVETENQLKEALFPTLH